MALLLPVVSNIREAGRAVACKNNLRQLAIAVREFEGKQNLLPTYWGSFPPRGNNLVAGSWFVHLLPHVGEGNEAYRLASLPGHLVQQTSVLISPAGSDYKPGYWQSNGGHWDTTKDDQTNHVGHTYTVTTQQWVGPPRTWVPAVGTPAKYRTAGGYLRIDATSTRAFSILACASDPSSTGADTLIPWNNQKWSLTNYQANVFVFGVNNAGALKVDQPVRLRHISDSLASTILFAEGMRSCDGTYRLAYWSDYQPANSHNFGVNWETGLNTYMFQTTPSPARCNNWRVQSLHGPFLCVAMADGSVRTVSETVSRKELTDPNVEGSTPGMDAKMGKANGVWDRLLLPRDHEGPVNLDDL